MVLAQLRCFDLSMLAAGISVGGALREILGRVGDSATVGASTSVDDREVAVSCTGDGVLDLRLQQTTSHDLTETKAPPGCQGRSRSMSGRIALRLQELYIELPNPPPPAANYVPAVITGSYIYIAGQVSVWNGECRYLGQLGRDVSLEDGQKAARLCGLNIIAQLKSALGDLDRVKRGVKVNAFVSSASNFTDQPKVVDGASDLFVQVFGEAGKHARSAVGVSQLPRGVCVEIDALFEIQD